MADVVLPAQRDRDLFKTLNSTHELYDEWQERWEVYRDTSGEAEPDVGTYLPKNELEPVDQYNFRKEISHWCPESARANSRIVAALYQKKPKRTIRGKHAADLDPFIDDSDGRGNGLNAAMIKIMLNLLAYGTTRILVNVPPAAKKGTGTNGELTQADVKEQKIGPRIVVYNPLNVIDWDVDNTGQLNMIRIREVSTRKVDPENPESGSMRVTRFIHFDRKKVQWWEFEGDEGREREISKNSGMNNHDLGVVPMVVKYWPQEMAPMIGASFIRYMSKLDVGKFQNESDREYATYLHAHPQLKIWTAQSIANKKIGVSTFLELHPGDATQGREDAEYVQAPYASFSAMDTAIDNKLAAIYRHSGADPMGTIAPTSSKVFESSGISRAWSFATSEALLLSDLADAAVEIEWGILDLACKWLGDAADEFEGDIQYPEDFDLSSMGNQIEEAIALEFINSPTFQRYNQKHITAAKMGDASAETLAKVHKEIDNNPLLSGAAARTVNPAARPKPGADMEAAMAGMDGMEEEAATEAEDETKAETEDNTEETTSSSQTKRTGKK